MKWLKKILRIIAIILPAFCLFFSPGASAKKYSIDGFSAYSYSYYTPLVSGDGLVPINSVPEIHVNSSTDIDPHRLPYLFSDYVSGDHCEYNLYSNSVYQSNNSYSWGRSFLFPDPSFLNPAMGTDALCRSLAPYGGTVGSFSMPDFVNSSIPADKTINVNSLLPYNFMYNNFYFNSTRTVDGVIYNDKFNVSDLLNKIDSQGSEGFRGSDYKYYGNRITWFSFPLSVDPTIESLTADSSIVISGDIVHDEDFSSTATISINSRFVNLSNLSPTLVTTSCNYSNHSWGTTTFLCTIPVPFATNKYGFDLIVSGSTIDSFATTILDGNLQDSDPEGFIQFENFTIILNDNTTAGGTISLQSLGSFPNVAPGMPGVDNDNADWFSSIINTFQFHLFFPFQAIFNMFNDGGSCVQIPILADMLHSNEVEYCPWFDATTRNIVTPVLGFSSMMLLFGFVMSWVKSSSGNYMEDEGRKISFGGKK